MKQFHAILSDELGDEFSTAVEALDRTAAYIKLRYDYPESTVVQIEPQSRLGD